MRVPGWWATLLLTLAAFRVYRLLAKDVILDPIRSRLVRLSRDWTEGQPVPREFRAKLSEFLTCPWCLGFWLCGIMLVAFCLVTDWLDWFGFFITWFAMSAAVGLISKLDADD